MRSAEGHISEEPELRKRSILPSFPAVAKLRQLMAAAVLATGVFASPAPAGAQTPPAVELEAGFMVGISPDSDDDHDEDKHDHHEDKHDHHDYDCEDEHEDEATHEHAPIRIGFTYTFAPYIETGEEDPRAWRSEDSHSHGHPVHRLKLQTAFTVSKILSIGPKFEVALPFEEDKLQIGLGGTFEFHLGRHEISPTGILRLGEGEDGEVTVTSWEAGLNYSGKIADWIYLGGGFLAEGHDGDVHWGFGPAIVLDFGVISISYDSAFGPGEQESNYPWSSDSDSSPQLWQHHHLRVIFPLGKKVGNGHSH